MVKTYSRNRARLVGTNPASQASSRFLDTRAISRVRPLDYFGPRLKEAMARGDVSPQDLSRAVGMDRKRIHALRHGSHLPNAGNLAAIAVALGVSTDWLLGIEDQGGARCNS